MLDLIAVPACAFSRARELRLDQIRSAAASVAASSPLFQRDVPHALQAKAVFLFKSVQKPHGQPGCEGCEMGGPAAWQGVQMGPWQGFRWMHRGQFLLSVFREGDTDMVKSIAP